MKPLIISVTGTPDQSSAKSTESVINPEPTHHRNSVSKDPAASYRAKIKFHCAMGWLIMALCGLIFSGCKSEKVDPQADFTGQYQVGDGSKAYTMRIEKKTANALLIYNFGGFMNLPINATSDQAAATDGSRMLTIPEQTFTNPSGKKLILSGTGKLTLGTDGSSELVIDYTVGGFTQYSSQLVAKRLP